MKKLLALLLGVVTISSAFSQNNPLWLRYPSISPDGKTIVFGYKGDLYRVDATGGVASPLTIHEAHDMMPVWSRDGKSIAFASDRYGNFDVFVMPATGGTPVRLTMHGAADYPYDFSVDSKQVIFGSAHNAPATSVRFASPRLFQNLYSVPVTGGRALLISAAGVENAHYNSKGTQIVFQDRKCTGNGNELEAMIKTIAIIIIVCFCINSYSQQKILRQKQKSNISIIQTINKLPDTIDGCSGLFASSLANIKTKNYLFLSNLQGLGIIKRENKLLYLKKDFKSSTDKIERYTGHGIKVILYNKKSQQTGEEVWRQESILEIIYATRIQRIKVVGECGC